MRKTVSAIAIVALLLTGCGGGTADSGEPLKIGVINPYSGDFALYGEDVTRGYELAIDEANANGGVNGRKLTLLRGDAMTPDQAISEATRLATNENVDVFTGTYISSVSAAASDVAARNDKLYWETNALSNDLTERGLENFLRVGPRAADFAEVSVAGVKAVANELGKDLSSLRVYIEHEDSVYGTSVATQQDELLRKAGVKVVGVNEHAAAATDVTDSVRRAKNANPDIWLVTGYVADTNLLLRTAQTQGFEPSATMLTGTGDTQETVEAVGADQLAGTLVTAYPGPDIDPSYGPGATKFLDAYRERYNSDPRAPQAMTGYVGMQVLIEALREAGDTTPAAARKAAMEFDKEPGALATGYGVKFDESGQNTRAKPVIIQWRNDGKKMTVFPAVAAGGNEIEGIGGSR